MNIQSALTEGLNILKNKSILSAKLDIEILMAKALGKKREYIILNNDNLKFSRYMPLINHFTNINLCGICQVFH